MTASTPKGDVQTSTGFQMSLDGNDEYSGNNGRHQGFFVNFNGSNGESSIGFSVGGVSGALSATQNFAFHGNLPINNESGKQTYNFYAAGTAPNFFTGNTYIGGDSTNLGTSSAINLLDTGEGQFSGGVKVTGGAQAPLSQG